MKQISKIALNFYAILIAIPNIFFPLVCVFSIYYELYTALWYSVFAILIMGYVAFTIYCLFSKNHENTNLKLLGLFLFSLVLFIATIYRPVTISIEDKEKIVEGIVKRYEL